MSLILIVWSFLSKLQDIQIFTCQAHFPLPLVYTFHPLPLYIGNWLSLHTCETAGDLCVKKFTTGPGGKLLVFDQSWFLPAPPARCLWVTHFHSLCVPRYIGPEEWKYSMNILSQQENSLVICQHPGTGGHLWWGRRRASAVIASPLSFMLRSINILTH